MKKINFLGFAALALMLVFTACNNDTDTNKGGGDFIEPDGGDVSGVPVMLSIGVDTLSVTEDNVSFKMPVMLSGTPAAPVTFTFEVTYDGLPIDNVKKLKAVENVDFKFTTKQFTYSSSVIVDVPLTSIYTPAYTKGAKKFAKIKITTTSAGVTVRPGQETAVIRISEWLRPTKEFTALTTSNYDFIAQSHASWATPGTPSKYAVSYRNVSTNDSIYPYLWEGVTSRDGFFTFDTVAKAVKVAAKNYLGKADGKFIFMVVSSYNTTFSSYIPTTEGLIGQMDASYNVTYKSTNNTTDDRYIAFIGIDAATKAEAITKLNAISSFTEATLPAQSAVLWDIYEIPFVTNKKP